MITEEQYNLMLLAENGVKHKDYAYGTFNAIKEYLYESDYMELRTTSGVKLVPTRYDLNAEGISQKEIFEKNRKHAADKAANRARYKRPLRDYLRDLSIAVMGGVIVLVIQKIIKLF